MKVFVRVFWYSLLLGVLVVPLGVFHAERTGGLDIGGLAAVHRQLLEEFERDEDLQAYLAAVVVSYQAKKEVAGALGEGRLSLRQAALRFREIDRQRLGFSWEAFRRLYPGATDDESHCWETIHAAKEALYKEPARAAALVSRLNAELRDWLARPGRFSLDALGRQADTAGTENPAAAPRTAPVSERDSRGDTRPAAEGRNR
jgi:hypothetical protein